MFEMLGAVDVSKMQAKPPSDSWPAVAATLAGGALGSYLWSRFPVTGTKHPVLGLLNGFALGGNVARVITKDIAPRRALENVGAHLMATAASLGLPSYPAIGYLAGAAGANLFLRRGDSYLERLDETVLGNMIAIGEDIIPMAGANYTDKETVIAVQRAIVAKSSGDPAFKDLATKLATDPSSYGTFGPATKAAVKAVQKMTGASQTGDIDEGVILALGVTPSAAPAKAALPSTSSTAIVRASREDDGPVLNKGGALLLGRPAWQVILASIGVLVAGGGVVAALVD